MPVFAILFLTLTEICSGTFQNISALIFICKFSEQKFFDFKTQKRKKTTRKFLNLKLNIKINILNK